jgi:hypothetical protein
MKKRFFIFLICILLGTGGLYAQTTLGDVNGVGGITIIDALMTAQYYVGLNPPGFISSAADVNCSGGVNIIDALMIAQYYVGLLTEFPCSLIPGGDETRITLNNNSIDVDGTGASANGTTVTISSAGLYTVVGYISDGRIIVDSQDDEKVEITLNDASIHCSNSAPIYVKDGKVKLILEGTNSIHDGASYVYDNPAKEEPNAAIFSKDDLTIQGTGSLTLIANFNDGINCRDDLKISSGTINITAEDDGLVGNESLEINGGDITIDSHGDCLKVTDDDDPDKGDIQIDGGTLDLTSDGDDALSAAIAVEITDGTMTISTPNQAISSDHDVLMTGGRVEVTGCSEAIEAESINLAGGSFIVYASDDALNATMGDRTEIEDGSEIIISGGAHYLNAANGDAIDSNGSFLMTGGVLALDAPSSFVNVAIDVNGSTTVSGGELIVVSSNSGMNEYPNGSSPQYSMAVMLSSSQPASVLCVRDSSGNELIKFRTERTFYSVIYSSPQLQYGATYTILTGGSVSGGTESDHIISGGSYYGGSTAATITIDSSPTTVSGNFNGGFGWP